MDKNNYELMKLTHIGKSLTAHSAGNEWFEAWETKDDAISSYYYRLAEAGEEI